MKDWRTQWAIWRLVVENAWGRWPLPYRYQVVIVGRESGNRSPLSFVQFRSLQAAMAWCIAQNERANSTGGNLTYYEWEKIR
jgi:hypothetical protein